MSNENFSLQKFIEDSKSAILNPKEHFATLSTTGGFGEPVIKAVIYGFIAGLGGRDIVIDDFGKVVNNIKQAKDRRDIRWIGIKR